MDIVIVGGGVYGCAVAWELSRRGMEVLLLEADAVAAGASGGEGKRGVRANGRDLRELPLMRLAYDLWPTLHEELDGPTGYARIGHLQLIEREREAVAAPAQAWMQSRQGIPTQLLDRGALLELEPHLSDRVVAALHCPLDGVSDHTATTRSYAQAARRSGARIREGIRVAEIERRGDAVSAVITDQEERIPVSRHLLLLCNTQAPRLLQSGLNLELPVWSRLPQALFTAPLDEPPLRHLIGHAHRRLAMKPGPARNVMISGGWLGRWNPETGRAETVEDQVAANLAEAVAVYPMLDGIAVQRATADRPESDTPDHIPMIDRAPGLENLFFATGWAGHGWAIAPAVARLLAGWVYTGSRAELLAPFRYARFSR